MANREISVASVSLDVDGRRVVLDSSLTREDVIELLGEPDDVGAVTQKHFKGQVLLYGTVEIHLNHADKVCLIFSDDAEIIRLAIPLGGRV
jgi:hypothetical protein